MSQSSAFAGAARTYRQVYAPDLPARDRMLTRVLTGVGPVRDLHPDPARVDALVAQTERTIEGLAVWLDTHRPAPVAGAVTL